MCQQLFRIAVMFALTFCFGIPLSAEPFPPSPASPAFFNKPESDPSLAANTRLDRKVTLDEVGTSLGNLMQKLSVADMPLTCAADYTDQKLQVRVKDRSLRSVMAALAQLTPSTWKREGKGYCLYADPKATEYENHWWQLYGLERERVLAALRAEILTEMQQKPILPDVNKPDPENTPYEMAGAMAQSQEFWYLLPEPLQEQIAGQIVDTAYYRSGKLFSTPAVEGAVTIPFQSLPLQAQTDILANADLLRMPGAAKFTNPALVAFNNIGFVVRPRIQTKKGKWYDVALPLSVHSEADRPNFICEPCRAA